MTITSPDISNLDYKVLFDVSKAQPEVVLTNLSTVINVAALDWWFVITTPSGSTIHNGNGTTPDIDNAAFTTKTYTTWPMPMGQIEWGIYSVKVFVRDSLGAEFNLEKKATIIRPVGSTAASKNNFGVASVIADMRCDQANLYVEDTTNYTWNGLVPTFPERRFQVVYPLDATDVQPPDFIVDDTNNALVPISFSGIGYQLVRRATAEYDEKDNVFVRIKYKYVKDFDVQCDVDLCPLMCEYQSMVDATEGGSCNPEASSKLVTINALINMALIAKQQPLCGIQVGPIIEQIKQLGNFDCDCGLSSGGSGISGSNQAGTLTMSVSATCGDLKVGKLTVTGSNVVLEMSDVSYAFAINQGLPGSFAQAFSYAVQITPDGCLKTITLSVDETKVDAYLTSYLTNWLSQQAGLGAPVMVNLVQRGTTNPPAGCPGPAYPLQIWSMDGLTQGAVVSSISELISALIADPGWGALGTWAPSNHCQLLLWKAQGVTTVPAIQTTDLSYTATCVNNKRDYIYKINTGACGGSMTGKTFPYDLRLTYTSGGTVRYIAGITSYTDLISKLNAQPNKPAHITFEAITGNEAWVLVRDADCSQNTQLQLLPSLSKELFYAVAMGDVPSTLGGSYLVDTNGPSELAIVCGSPQSNQRNWHSIRVGNLIYYVDSANGAMHRLDVTDPLNPIHTVTGTLPNTVGGNTAFGGTAPALWDVYFHTDLRTTGGGFLYIVESSSGFIWKYSIGSDTVVGYDWNQLLVGRMPRCIIQGTLWLTLDGTRDAAIGATLTNKDRLHFVTLSTISMTPGSTVVTAAAGPLIAGEEVWAASWDGKRRCVWVTTQNAAATSTSLVKCDESGNVMNTYLGAWVQNAGVMAHTHIFGDRIYLSEKTNGTRYMDLNNPFLAPVVFEPLVIGGITHTAHWNFYVPNGCCYGIQTFDRGLAAGTRGGFAKYSLDGKFISGKIGTVFGNTFNIIPIYNTTFGVPNGLCQ